MPAPLTFLACTALLDEFAITDDTGLAIFADYLEERGYPQEAWMCRLFTEANRHWLIFDKTFANWIRWEAHGGGYEGGDALVARCYFIWLAKVSLSWENARARAVYQLAPTTDQATLLEDDE